jgi:hypothetical protein
MQDRPGGRHIELVADALQQLGGEVAVLDVVDAPSNDLASEVLLSAAQNVMA